VTEAEQGIIGCILVDSECVYKLYDKLKPEMFDDKFCKDCYTEMLAMYDLGIKIATVELSQRLENRTYDVKTINKFLIECVRSCPTSALCDRYARTIMNEYKAMNVKNMIERVSLLPKDIDSTISELIARCEELQENKSVKSKTIAQIVKEQKDHYFKDIERNVVKSGFYKLDECTGGFEGGDVTVIGARPAVGKSAIALQMIEHISSCGKKVGYFNLEMTEPQVFQRMNSRLSSINITRIRRAKNFIGDEKENFEKANEKMSKMNVVVSTGTKSVSEIRNESRHQKFDVIMIDYLQLIKSDRQNANRAAEVGYISKAIKSLAMELNVPIILLSQLNRTSESRETKEPSMTDLRESGDIEQDASIILLLWKLQEDSNSLIGLKCDKNRNGSPNFKEGLSFDGEHVAFTECQEEFKQILRDSKFKTCDENETPFG
jgi:replicative DNA helicase